MNTLAALFVVLFTNVAAPTVPVAPVAGTIHTVRPTRQPRFTKAHVASAPVVRHVWEVTDSDGCVTRPIEGNANGGVVRFCQQ